MTASSSLSRDARTVPDRRLSVAPMMDWTDRHCRYFHRLLSRRTLLYTEMVTAAAIVHGDPQHLLRHDVSERSLALQIGGSEPVQLARACSIAQHFDFDEINLNIGCPSDRVQSGRFGACLMAEPQKVAECVAAMVAATYLPITIKTRIGIDEHDSYRFLRELVRSVADAGCTSMIIHARKAWLKGLSPKQNRTVPPLDYERVYQIKQEFPQLEIVINGGISTLVQAEAQLRRVDGVMLGRAAYHDPYLLAAADRVIFGCASGAKRCAEIPTRHQVVARLLPYIERQLDAGVRLAAMTRHILGLYRDCPGAKLWRRHISQNAHLPGASVAVVEEALDQVRTAAARACAYHRADGVSD